MPLPLNIPQCQHIRYTGERCGSPAMRGLRNCFYHEGSVKAADLGLVPHVEDATSMQVAIASIMQALLRRRMDHKTATALLYALQVNASIMPLARRELALAKPITERPADFCTESAARDAGKKVPATKRVARSLTAATRKKQTVTTAKQPVSAAAAQNGHAHPAAG